MNLVNLLVALRDALTDPEQNRAFIARLLRSHDGLAEFEVARHFVASQMGDRVKTWAAHPDPRVRADAMEFLRYALPRGAMIEALQRGRVDPSAKVKARADTLTRRWRGEEDQLRGAFDTQDTLGVIAWQTGAPAEADVVSRRKAKKPPAPPRSVAKALKSVADLCEALGVDDVSTLRKLTRAGAGKGAPYVAFSIAKRTGGERTITAPRKDLKAIQRKLYDEVLAKLPTHEAAHGFVKHRSVVSNAKPHEGAALVLKIDLADFFPTMHFRRVAGYFSRVLRAPLDVANLIASLTTWRPVMADGFVVMPGVVPQGAPTSPALANLLCRRLDGRLAGLAEKAGAAYTRYADDLTFSWKDAAPNHDTLGRFVWWVSQIALREGFAVNRKKTRVMRRSGRQLVTGVVVNEGLHVPRETRRQLRAMLHDATKNGLDAAARGRPGFLPMLLGHAAWVKSVDRVHGDALLDAAKKLHAQAVVTP